MSRATLALALLLVPAAAEAGPPPNDKPQDLEIAGDDVVIAPGERVGNLNAFGGDVEVLGEVAGNLGAFGGDVVLHGPVAGDVTLFGGDLEVDGDIAGNVWLTGGDAIVRGRIAGDVYTTGGDVTVKDGGVVAGKVHEGPGGVDPDHYIEAAPLPAWVKRIVPGTFSVLTLLAGVFKLLVWATAWFLALGLFGIDRHRFTAYVESLALSPGRGLAWGALAMAAVSAVAGLCLLSVIGMPLTFLILFILGGALQLGLGLAGAALGSALPWSWLARRAWAQLSVGCMLLAFGSLVPYVGNAVMFAAAVAGLGGIVLSHKKPARVVPVATALTVAR